MKSNYLTLGAAAAVLLVTAGTSSATTYEKTVTTTPVTRANTVNIDFMEFDLNGDGVLSKNEVGSRLFYIFDTDNNEVIDNREIEAARVYTVTPVEQQTVFKVDFDDDGIADMAEVTYDSFLEQSALARFSSADQLSAREFIDHSFLELDQNDSKVIERREWVAAYNDLVDPVAEVDRFND